MSRPQLADMVEEYTETTGTDPIVVTGAKPNRQPFSVLGSSVDEVDFIVDSGSSWVNFKGTYDDSTKTLTRDTVLDSSNGGSDVSFGAGVKTVRLVASANFLSRLAGHGLPSPAGDETTPGVTVGEDGTGIYFVESVSASQKILCTAVDGADHTRFYKSADVVALTVGFPFDNSSPNSISGTSHVYDGSVVKVYDSDDSTIILQSGLSQSIVFSTFGGFPKCYRMGYNGGRFKIEELVVSTGAVQYTFMETVGSRLKFGGSGIEARNIPYTFPVNTQIGISSGESAVGGAVLELVSVGYEACQAMTVSNLTTAVGYQAMVSSNNVSRAVMVGALAGGGCGASDNVGIGYRACGGAPSGGGTTSGTGNVAIGSDALLAITTAASNVGLGFESGTALTTGDENTLLGNQSGDQLTTGSGNVFLGNRAGEHLGNISNAFVVGNAETLDDCLIVGDFAARTLKLFGEITVNDYALPEANGTTPFGFKVSNNSSNPTTHLDIAAGQNYSSDRSVMIAVSAMTKDFSSAWAGGDGNGGLDAGSMPTNGGLFIYAIYHPSGGRDFIASTNAPSVGPSLPSGYTKYSYINWRPTNGSANFYVVCQSGNDHVLQTHIEAYNDSNPGTSNVDFTVQCPPNTSAELVLALYNSNASAGATSLAIAGTASTPTGNDLFVQPNLAIPVPIDRGEYKVVVDESSQCRFKLSSSSATLFVSANLKGWRDPRIALLGGDV